MSYMRDKTTRRLDTFAVADAAEGIFIPAAAFESGLSGSPTLTTTGQFAVWNLNATTSQVIRAVRSMQVPWPLVDIDLIWTNTSSASGAVQMRLDIATVVDGASMSSLAATQTFYFSEKVPAQNVVEVTNISSAITMPSGVIRFLLRTTAQSGASGAGIGSFNSLGANTIGIIGMHVRPTSSLSASRLTSAPLPGMLGSVHNVNGAAFQTDTVVTVGADQYAVWNNDANRPVVGKRSQASGIWGAWSTSDLGALPGNPFNVPTTLDGHNGYTLGVDSAGYIHVSGNHHSVPIQIVRSVNPADITAWVVDDTSGIPAANINAVTYVQFITGPDGALWMWARQGGSGNGAMFVHKYDTAAKKWNYVARPLTGFVTDGATTDQSPYIHTPVVDANGIWHLFFMWRTTDDLSTTHDFGYIRSTDATAQHWRTAAGIGVNDQTMPQDTAPLLWTGFYDQINQSGATVDANNYPHCAMWVRVNNAGANSATAPSVLRHYYYDGSAWQADDEVVTAGASPTFRSRPQLFTYSGHVFAMYSDWPVIGVTPGAAAPRSFTRWWLRDISTGSTPRIKPFIFLTENMGNNEFPFDRRGVAAGKLNVIATATGSNGATSGGDVGQSQYASTPGRVLTLDLADILANPPA